MKNQFKILGDITEVYIKSKGEEFTMLMDTEDLPKLEEFNSTIYIDKDGYAIIRKNGVHYRINRLFMNTPKGLQADHINRIKLDNRKCNLRNVTGLVNSHNKSTKGICYNKKDNLCGWQELW